MTARRPSRISGRIPTRSPRDEKLIRRLLHTLNDERWEGEAASTVQRGGNHPVHQVVRDLPDETVIPLLHPASTYYGSAFATTDPPPVLERLPTPTCARRRSRNPTLSRWESSNTPKPFPFAECQCEGPDLVEPFDTGSPCVGRTHNSSIDVRKKLWRRASDDLLGNDENQGLSRSKGSNRARRASTRNEIPNEEGPQPQNIHGAALLRVMRRKRARRFSLDGHSEDGPFSWEGQDLPTVIPSLGSNSRVAVFDEPAATDAAEKSIHNWPREKSGESMLRRDDDTVDLSCNKHSIDSVLLSNGDQWRPMQMPRAPRSRTSVSCRYSQPSSPSHTARESRWRILRDGLSGTAAQPSGHEERASDDDSANSQEDAILTHRLTDLSMETLASTAQDLGKNVERHPNDDPGLTFTEYMTEPSLVGEQRQKYLPPAAPLMANSDLSTSGQNPFQHQYITPIQPIEESVRTGQLALAQGTSSQKCGAGKGALVSNHNHDLSNRVDGMVQTNSGSFSGNRTILLSPGKCAEMQGRILVEALRLIICEQTSRRYRKFHFKRRSNLKRAAHRVGGLTFRQRSTLK